MPATTMQLLATIPSLRIAATFGNPGISRSSVSTRQTLRLVAVGRASSPRPMTASGILLEKLSFSGRAAMTNFGILSARSRINLSAAGASLATSYNPQTALGLIPYGGIAGNNVLLSGLPASLVLNPADIGMPATLGAANGWVSPPIQCLGMKHVAWAMTSTQTINLSLTRYLDRQGIASIGAVTTTATANAAMSLDNADGKAFLSFSLAATNTTASIASFSSVALLIAAS